MVIRLLLTERSLKYAKSHRIWGLEWLQLNINSLDDENCRVKYFDVELNDNLPRKIVTMSFLELIFKFKNKNINWDDSTGDQIFSLLSDFIQTCAKGGPKSIDRFSSLMTSFALKREVMNPYFIFLKIVQFNRFSLTKYIRR